MKVHFVQDAVITTEEGEKCLFKKGANKDLNEASAERWLRRGVAVTEADHKASKKGGTVTDDDDNGDGNGDDDNGEDLNALTVPELKGIAEELEIEGFGKLKKAELIEAIEAAESE